MAESLGLLREAVDEIVIAADARVDATDLAHYADVADVLLRYEYAGGDRQWPWLAAQARGDWLLVFDGDELPSAALVGALPELVADRGVRQYSLPIHWPWPGPAARIAQEPWTSDRRLRLLRNDPGLTFAARTHAHADADPPIRFLRELPVYHLDLLLPDRARREAKAARYDSELFGLLTPEGVPFNRAFYLPEADRGRHETIALPREDAESIERALAARRDDSRRLDPSTLPLHDSAAVAWYCPRPSLPDDAYRGAVELAGALPPFTAGGPDRLVWVEVRNDGTARWPGGDGRDPLIRLGMAWQPVGGGPRHDAGRALLPHRLDPGERALLPVTVGAPPEAGPTELILDLVHENVRWFDRPFTARVEVGDSVDRRLAALTERHGPLIPPAAAIGERRTVGARDGLVRQGMDKTAPADPEIAKLTDALAVEGWAVDAGTIDRLAEVVRGQRPAAVVEFGGGSSTIVLASLLAELHRGGRRLISFEHDPTGAERTRAALAARGLDRIATVVQLPLGRNEEGPPCYLLTDEAIRLLRRAAPQLILVDGPAPDSGASRLGTLDLVAPYLREDATVLLDDALRDAELCVAAAWESRDDIAVHGIRATSTGLLEGTLRAPARRRRLAPFLRKRWASASS